MRSKLVNVVVALSGLFAVHAVAGDDPPATGVRIVEDRQVHVLEAGNLDEVVARIRAQSDGRAPVVARTRSELQVTYRLVPTDPGCRVEGLDVAVAVTVIVPDWTPPKATRPELREQWERMRTGVEIHEQGHRDNAVEAAERLNERLRALAPGADADCAALERRFLRERIKAQMRVQNRDEAYDRRTRHGITQAPKPPEPDPQAQDRRGARDLRDRGEGRNLSERAGY